MKVTIRDVARRAGVGVATVSRVLNGTGYVKAETRERVLAAAAELGYVPSQLARGLVRRLSGTVGLVVPDITNPFFPLITRGVEDAASEAGYTVFLCNTDNDPVLEAQDVRKLREHRVDGIIFVGTTERRELVDQLLADDIPVVVMDRQLEHADVDTVTVDNVAGAQAACRHLIELGHRRIAHAAGHQSTRTGQDRCQGYRMALEEADIPYDPACVTWGDFTFESGFRVGQVLLGLSPRPTAVFAGNDLIALGVIRAAEEAGLSVPDDLSVVGFDNIQMAALVRPGLTTVRQPAREMGRLAMTMLLERIRGEFSGPGRRHVYPPELIVRGTTRRREPLG
ncbi:LacI family DNA-binding transcriptional regulator [Symbiobacterium thermophilum]|uniref:LacI family DNA-binding transcriptional regulator n=1 Tax=Symbiobacterium thermophilum TaxID=2734 RepID=UPI00030189C3|nr:LacI family DNA-binding transcriptional regulator [Symbiobacterium thermophilum]